jgi:LmbE family N-acetylglucosaminyl deacetylase
LEEQAPAGPDEANRMKPFAGLSSVKRVLCLGAHSDDVEIGAGATVMRIVEESPDVAIQWICFSGQGTPREAEAAGSANAFGSGRAAFAIHGFADTKFPLQHAAIKDVFNALKAFEPDLVLTQSADDRHQDHRTINELTWNAFRAHQIWEYEIPKWDGDLQRPNLYVPVSPELMGRKVSLLMEHFESQRSKHWFDDETFRALARLRGLECNSRYAEAFVIKKLVV